MKNESININQIMIDVEEKYNKQIPFRHRGIKIEKELIQATVEILSESPNKILPQNARNLVAEETPDGLDRRIKERLESNLRTANIISDVLEEVGVVKVKLRENPNTGRSIKYTELII